jgi:hypothetical protein
MEVCKICGRPADHMHHVFGGPNRKHSEKYNLKCPLCLYCHNKVHQDYQQSLILKIEYQQIFEAQHGHDAYMRIFGKSYL